MFKNLFNDFVVWLGSKGVTPNQITLGRLFFFVPGWLIWVYSAELANFTGMDWRVFGYLALLIVTIVIIFDIVDGALARATGQVSDKGKILDPIVDKLITYSSLILFWPVITKPGFILLLILDISSTFLRGNQVQGANQYGKKKALSQNISKFFFGMAVLTGTAWLSSIGNFLICFAVVLASISVGIRVLPEKIKRSIMVAIPQILTLGNLAAGLGTIWCAFSGAIELGVVLNFMAMAFDLIDGAVARKLGVASKFGKHFDSVADMVSFGAGPAMLVAALNNFSPMAIGLCSLYFIATAIRLYDYGRSKDKTPSGFFRGLPSPAAAWLVVSSVLFHQPLACLLVLVLAALLMCLFQVNWIHFSNVALHMTIPEIGAAIIIGAIMTMLAPPGGFVAGPIIVYLFSPSWRKPA